jgi:hypothetical protein
MFANHQDNVVVTGFSCFVLYYVLIVDVNRIHIYVLVYLCSNLILSIH